MQAGDAAVVIVVLVVAVPDGRRPDQLARQTVTVRTTVVAIHAVSCHRHTQLLLDVLAAAAAEYPD